MTNINARKLARIHARHELAAIPGRCHIHRICENLDAEPRLRKCKLSTLESAVRGAASDLGRDVDGDYVLAKLDLETLPTDRLNGMQALFALKHAAEVHVWVAIHSDEGTYVRIGKGEAKLVLEEQVKVHGSTTALNVRRDEHTNNLFFN